MSTKTERETAAWIVLHAKVRRRLRAQTGNLGVVIDGRPILLSCSEAKIVQDLIYEFMSDRIDMPKLSRKKSPASPNGGGR